MDIVKSRQPANSIEFVSVPKLNIATADVEQYHSALIEKAFWGISGYIFSQEKRKKKILVSY